MLYEIRLRKAQYFQDASNWKFSGNNLVAYIQLWRHTNLFKWSQVRMFHIQSSIVWFCSANDQTKVSSLLSAECLTFSKTIIEWSYNYPANSHFNYKHITTSNMTMLYYCHLLDPLTEEPPVSWLDGAFVLPIQLV